MDQLNELGEQIYYESEELKLDESVKRLFAFKPVLARIFKETVSECRNLTHSQIEGCIEGEVLVSTVCINPGVTNAAKIEGRSQEDAVRGEGKNVYDIRTVLMIPQQDEPVEVKLLINIEAQKDDTPGYDIPLRAIFHCCRMVSAQLGTEFSNNTSDPKKYANIKKVYSIWICTETPKCRANTIEFYDINRNVWPAQKDARIPRYDIINAVIVNLSKEHDTEGSESEMIRFLTDLLNEKMQGPEKIRLLKEKYQLPVTDDFEKEVLVMTAYAAGLLKKGEIEGEINGEIKGEFKVNTLNDWLFSQDRVEDIRKATKDPEFQKTLFREMEESRKKDD